MMNMMIAKMTMNQIPNTITTNTATAMMLVFSRSCAMN